jgi:parallel beta-helix repeat protein
VKDLRRNGLLVATLGIVLSVAVSGCAAPTPEPLARRDVPAAEAVDPAAPCLRGPADPGSDPPAGAGANASFDQATNTITLAAGENVSIPALSDAIRRRDALREVGPGEWLLGANVVIVGGASLRIGAPDVRWLKMASGGGRFVAVTALGGGLDIRGSCITSWDESVQKVDENYDDGRSFLLARDGATLNIDRAEIRYLGSGAVESYGLSWRTAGSTGSITNSVVSHLYFGLYSYEVSGLRIQDNEFYDNVLYGVDPHTGSSNLVIERNTVYNNGKHGIILAEDVIDSVIRDNVVYGNAHHGIVTYLRSDRNLIEGNESFGNAAQGININESAGNTIRNNKVYDNAESGIGVTQSSAETVVEGNQVRGNKQDGVRLVSESSNTAVRNNTIGENGRYGVYIDTEGEFELAGNLIFGSRAGIMAAGVEMSDAGDNQVFDNTEVDIASR